MSCPVSWCQSAHQGGGAHYVEFDAGPVVLLLLQSSTDRGDAGLVRITYPVGGTLCTVEVTPQLCADVADMLAAVPADALDGFVAALYRAHTILRAG